jgi:hypothetical protein
VEGESNSWERAQIMRQIYMTRSEFEYPPPRSLLIPGAEPTCQDLWAFRFQNGTMKSANISQHLKLLQPGTTKGSRAVISCSYPNGYAFQPPSTVRFSPLMNADSG